MEDAHQRTTSQVLEYFGITNANVGMSETKVNTNRAKYGKNEIPEEAGTPLWELVLEQFKDQLVIILLVSAIISFGLALLEEGHDKGTAFVEPAVILLILIANAIVGVVQESNAEKAIEALMEYTPDEATVIRDGITGRVHSNELVPGDIVRVAVGDKIPADCRVVSITSASFTIDQAVLTGESVSVSKNTNAIDDPKAVKQDMVNMLFSGTTVVTGSAIAIVALTGTRTAIGDIHTSISAQITEKTPLKQKVDDFGDMLAKVISIICILVWVVNIRNFGDPSHGGLLKGAIYYFKIAVALAVAAIPEGLPVVITLCLALGTKKMAKKNAIVRSLPSVETLGCTNIICADKTGTLTTNQMSVAKFIIADGSKLSEYTVEGTTFAPDGDILSASGKPAEKALSQNPSVKRLAQICSVCNDSKIAYNEDNGVYSSIGEPTEAALKVLVEKIGSAEYTGDLNRLPPSARMNAINDHLVTQHPRLLTFEFSRDRKSMSVLAQSAPDSNKAVLLVKGAPESILDRCTSLITTSGTAPFSDVVRTQLQNTVLEYGKTGLRVLALAYIDDVDPDSSHYHTSNSAEYAQFEQNMIFVGLVGMLDPPRPEVRGAISKCRSAGIRIMVITGDNKNTAETICRQIGVFGLRENLTGKSYTGKEFEALSRDEKVNAVLTASLFSRTEPGHKRQLVDLLQEQGLVVAMTGDGVNDAPALKRASIGIAMGSGTDVAKLAADMVLADNNFASIEQAVEEGRSIYENTKQFIRYLISSNIGEVVSIFLTVVLGMPEALIPVQLLWVNLVTDGLPATALGFNPPDHTTHFHACSTKFAEIGCDMFVNESARRATTVSLSILVTIEMANALNSLSENESLLTLPPWDNLYLCGAIVLSMSLHFMILYVPFLADLFVITPLNWDEWKAVLYISLPVILIDEALKFVSQTFVNPPAKIKKE
ncbi:MAG: hypothetical protein CYPHOPRED_004004 [Cyphobasidiales sp. Tagirdzhanova-0007]|nr:MAG: hypothetical protein CYPHOPRED_004004 [Cyphobasidiales sp. Tagirdzhanova-0007]